MIFKSSSVSISQVFNHFLPFFVVGKFLPGQVAPASGTKSRDPACVAPCGALLHVGVPGAANREHDAWDWLMDCDSLQ
jgi:hypothetical protein